MVRVIKRSLKFQQVAAETEYIVEYYLPGDLCRSVFVLELPSLQEPVIIMPVQTGMVYIRSLGSRHIMQENSTDMHGANF